MSDLAKQLSQTLQRLLVLTAELGDGPQEQLFDDPSEQRELASSLNQLVTQLEAQVERLSASRDHFEAVLDSMREGVIALDEDNHIKLANKSACALLGWSAPPLHEHIDACVEEESLKLFVREQTPEEAPWVELELKGRRTVLAQLTAQSSRGDAVLVLNDITALRRLETVRRDFVQNVSHELRTPTTVIKANAETLLGGAMEQPQLARTFLEGIERNAQRLAHLVSDLLDLARIESGTYQMSAEAVWPHRLIQQVVDTLAEQIIQRELKVQIQVDDQLSLSQDAGALEQVLTNLIENAVNYSFDRGRITLRATPFETELKGRAQRSWLRFEVIDSGPGIADKHKARIFERFYRVDKGRSRHLGGTGLGLAIVKHLCHAMGGEVGLESQEGAGCTFWFEIPQTLSRS